MRGPVALQPKHPRVAISYLPLIARFRIASLASISLFAAAIFPVISLLSDLPRYS